jgi:hypothetical protein
MPVRKSLSGNEFVETIPKKTSQGTGKHTKYAATSSNKPKKGIEDKEDSTRDLRVSFFMINNLYLPLFHACRKD